MTGPIEPDEYSIESILMTPELAKEIIRVSNAVGGSKNRPLRPAKVQIYAKRMKARQWEIRDPQGCMVCLDSLGRVVQGNTRLHAIIESGVSIPWMIVRGCSEGMLLRQTERGQQWTGGDYFSANGACDGLFTDPKRLVAISRMLHCLDNHAWDDPAADVKLEVCKKYRTHLDWVGARVAKHTDSPFIAAIVWAKSHIVLSEELRFEELLRQVETGVEISPNGAAIHMRRLRMKGDIGRESPSVKVIANDRWLMMATQIRLIEGHLRGEGFSRMPSFKADEAGSLSPAIRNLLIRFERAAR